jgi:hypothetical protein
MKTIKSSKDITTLEVGDKVVFSDLKYVVTQDPHFKIYYLVLLTRDDNDNNDKIFEVLNINKIDFIEKLGINTKLNCPFPETFSLEALTAIVSALFKEYEKQNELPKTWEEFCDKYPVTNNEVVISDNSDILTFDELPNTFTERDPDVDRNFCTSLQEAEAFLALMQLRQLRKAYVKDWEPDCKQQYYGIISNVHGIDILPYTLVHKSMSFPTHELANQFLNNFKDLLEIAKPLL